MLWLFYIAMAIGVIPDRCLAFPICVWHYLMAFFKQIDWIYLVFAILSKFQSTYPLSGCHGTDNVRPLNTDVPKGEEGVHASHLVVVGPLQAEGLL